MDDCNFFSLLELLMSSHVSLHIFQLSLCDPQFFALSVLDDIIKTQWKILPTEQSQGKSYLAFDENKGSLSYHDVNTPW